MILVFDLDDTLYEEKTFVLSGFKAVAQFLSNRYGLSRRKVMKELLQELKYGRGVIFNNVLDKYNLNRAEIIRKCLSIYRLHKPVIELYADARKCLKRFRNRPIYIVTDGNKIVQANKVRALGLDKHVNGIYVTHRFGVHNAKPSPFCFLKIVKRERVSPDKVVYIADNPLKDFVGIRPLGFKTIRILRGNYKHLKPQKKFNADLNISTLDELTEGLLLKL